MTRNEDGSIVLQAEDQGRLDALLIWAFAHTRDPGVSTSENANQFIAEYNRLMNRTAT